MTLRELWSMAVGRREEQRQLLLSEGWVISQLFADRPATEWQLAAFIRTGGAGDPERAVEPRIAEVDERVAAIFAHGGKIPPEFFEKDYGRSK